MKTKKERKFFLTRTCNRQWLNRNFLVRRNGVLPWIRDSFFFFFLISGGYSARMRHRVSRAITVDGNGTPYASLSASMTRNYN